MNSPRVVIFANGQFSKPEKHAALLKNDDRIVCADGGANFALDLGLLPEIVIGDLDSIKTETLAFIRSNGIRTESAKCDQAKTDLEVSINYARDTGAREILLLTALGGRLDHMVANLMLASREDLQDIQITFFDGETRAIYIHSGQSFTVEGDVGDLITLIPFSRTATGVLLENAKWPLNDATLERGNTLSVSNYMTSKKCTLSVSKGTVLFLHTPLSTLSSSSELRKGI